MHEAFFDVTAISFHAYPYLQDKYALMACGGSVGENYGPMIVAPHRYTHEEIKKIKIAVPGTLTTYYIKNNKFDPEKYNKIVPFEEIIPQVLAGKYQAGLIIHEGQLTYGNNGLSKIIDLGVWWREQTRLPLPLGGNAIKRSLGPEAMRITTKALRDSIQHGLDNRESALGYAMQFARDLDPSLADKFVGMYVNERTLNYGADGREAIRKLLEMGHERGIIPEVARLDFID